jgi:hypothetical protein
MKVPGDRLTVHLIATVVLALTSVSAQSALLIVTNTNDSGTGSLRDTIAAAAAGDTIQFDTALNGQAITLTTAELAIGKNLTIEGPGADRLTVQRSTASGTPEFRIFTIANQPGSVAVTIAGLTISNGNALGGGIFTNVRTLTIDRCVISGNSHGGIANAGSYGDPATVNIINSTISGNDGGGVSVAGPGFYGFRGGEVTITGSTISGNFSASNGGGIYNAGGLTIAKSTISGNSADADSTGGGGGIFNVGILTITDSTISGNLASRGGGGGIRSYFANAVLAIGRLTITNSTITGNSASEGGGLHLGGTQTSRNTIIALNTAANAPDVKGELASEGFNLIGNNSGAAISPAQTSDQIGTPASPIDPLLVPLQDNGGPTFTHALLQGSPAIDQGESSGATADQRGFNRPVDFPAIANAAGGDGADIGAFESAPAKLANISTRLRVATGDNAMIGGFIITGTEPKTELVRGIGPSLVVPGALVDPIIEVHGPSGQLLGANDNWRDAETRQQISDSGLAPVNDLESALWGIIEPGAYTAIVRGKDDASGIGLFEVYDLDLTANSRLANVSTRGFVDTGDNVMIGGIITAGSAPTRIVLRGIGPSLTNFGVPNPLQDPILELYDGNGQVITTNYNWRDDQEAEIIATGIPPSNDQESAIVRDLSPGAYTVIVRGNNNTTGVALVEIYSLN